MKGAHTHTKNSEKDTDVVKLILLLLHIQGLVAWYDHVLMIPVIFVTKNGV